MVDAAMNAPTEDKEEEAEEDEEEEGEEEEAMVKIDMVKIDTVKNEHKTEECEQKCTSQPVKLTLLDRIFRTTTKHCRKSCSPSALFD